MTALPPTPSPSLNLLRGPQSLLLGSLKQARSFGRRYLMRRRLELSDVLLLWYGSFGMRGGPTLGDLKAVNHVSGQLRSSGLDHRIVTADFDFKGHTRVGSIFDVAPPRRGLVFVCGPLTNWSDLVDYLDVCKAVPKVAVGVSVLPAHREPLERFDCIVARDGVPGASFDLAIEEVRPPPRTGQPLRRVALCLRGPQGEYGVASQDRRAVEAFRRLAEEAALDLVDVDTLLVPGEDPLLFDAVIDSVDAVFTTRMHGALLSLAAGKPVIALDQIPGGAKVSAVLRRVDWPFVFDASQVSAEQLSSAWQHLQHPRRLALLEAAQNRIREESAAAMDSAMAAIRRACSPDPALALRSGQRNPMLRVEN